MVLFIGCPCMYNFCSFCHFMAFMKDSFLFDNQYAFMYTLHLHALFYFRGFTISTFFSFNF